MNPSQSLMESAQEGPGENPPRGSHPTGQTLRSAPVAVSSSIGLG